VRIFLLVLIVAFAENVGARVRAAASRIDSARTILVITAHPDDEILIAPLLANRCVRGGASCSIHRSLERVAGACLGLCRER
jgi:hypothetical protein